jgi:hypothetical protein
VRSSVVARLLHCREARLQDVNDLRGAFFRSSRQDGARLVSERQAPDRDDDRRKTRRDYSKQAESIE